MWPLQDQSRTRFRLLRVSSQKTSNLKYRLLPCNHRVGWQHHSWHQGFWLAGRTDRGNQRCSVFPALGSNHSGLGIVVLVTVAALPCVACTLGHLGFALFQVPQLSVPSLLSWVASTTQPSSKVLCRVSLTFPATNQGASIRTHFPLEIVPAQESSGLPSRPPFILHQFTQQMPHTHVHLYIFCHRSCTNTWLTCTLNLLRHSVLSAILLLRSEISSPFLTAYLFHCSHICSCFNTFMKQRRILF